MNNMYINSILLKNSLIKKAAVIFLIKHYVRIELWLSTLDYRENYGLLIPARTEKNHATTFNKFDYH